MTEISDPISFEFTSPESRSDILVWEFWRDLGFLARRIYILENSHGEKNQEHGSHAHKSLNQVMICLKGKAKIELFLTSKSLPSFTFNLQKNQGIFLQKGYWREIILHPDSSLLVLADAPYDECDYIRNWRDFESWRKE